MIKAGVVGGTGYTGVELLRLLATHGGVEVTAITSRAEAGVKVGDYFPSLRGRYDLAFSDPSHFARFFRKQTGTTPQDFRAKGGG